MRRLQGWNPESWERWNDEALKALLEIKILPETIDKLEESIAQVKESETYMYGHNKIKHGQSQQRMD